MLTIYEYIEIIDWDVDIVQKCCYTPQPPKEPPTDCCYDIWKKELCEVTIDYNHITAELQHVQNHLNVMTVRRDKFKTWYDELTSANDLAKKICHQLEVMHAQVNNICINTEFTVKSIKILYCMIREFYTEVDYIKLRYDQLINCIKCLNNPALVSGQGIVKVLEDYYAKLTALIGTRDALLAMIMEVIDLSIRLHKEICDHYGLRKILEEWKKTFNCEAACIESPEETPPPHHHHHHEHEGEHHEVFHLYPILSFPICNDPYYFEVHESYRKDKEKVKELTKKLLELTKKQEALSACQQSLTTAISSVDPKARCN